MTDEDIKRLDVDVRQCLEGAFPGIGLLKGHIDVSAPFTRSYELHVDGETRKAFIALWEIERLGSAAAQEIAQRLKKAVPTPDIG